ncbi:hypothetical protein ACFXKC_57395 [Streptomyces sp. NPDC059340]|uniref:hypothetical protein n=1 Tax=Streptomyces sp. NPDC059340 TaxID=3346806 RepID=UPI0036A3CDA1
MRRTLNGNSRSMRGPHDARSACSKQDTPSTERPGRHEQAANLGGESAFAVDYIVCGSCRRGWVEQSYTLPQYQRCGPAGAGLAVLRAERI